MAESSKKQPWQEIARRGRNHAVLCVDFLAESFRQRMVERKMKWGFSPKAYRQFDGARWFYQKDVEKYYAVIKKSEARKPGYLLQKAKEYEALIKRIRAWEFKASVQNFKTLSNAGLLKIFQKYLSLYMESNGFIYNYLFINDYLAKELSDILLRKQTDTQRQMSDLFALMTPIKASEMIKEKHALATLAQKVQNLKLQIEKGEGHTLILEHLKKFAHLNRYIFYGSSYTASDIARRVKDLLKGDSLLKTVKDIKENKNSEKKIKNLCAFYHFDKPTMLKIQASRWWAYVPNFWDETFIYGVHCLMPFFQEIAKRMNLTYAELIEMKYKEIEELLQNGRQTSFSFKKELAMRYRDSALVLEHGKVSLLIGKELKQYYGREKRQLNYGLDIRELRGQPASPGRAEGRVSIVHSVNEIGKVKRGEVLVTSATTPMHLPAMEKSVAIVTDEGGLLSHAAIVSRELKIPCVVGTKIATRVFKDGDLVEVDAEKGIVRKLV